MQIMREIISLRDIDYSRDDILTRSLSLISLTITKAKLLQLLADFYESGRIKISRTARVLSKTLNSNVGVNIPTAAGMRMTQFELTPWASIRRLFVASYNTGNESFNG